MAQPTSAPPGKVEVIEFFWYAGPQCYKLEPTIEAFVKKGAIASCSSACRSIQERGSSLQSKFYYSLSSVRPRGETHAGRVYRGSDYKDDDDNCASMADQANFLPPRASTKRSSWRLTTRPACMTSMRQATKLIEEYRIDV